MNKVTTFRGNIPTMPELERILEFLSNDPSNDAVEAKCRLMLSNPQPVFVRHQGNVYVVVPDKADIEWVDVP